MRLLVAALALSCASLPSHALIPGVGRLEIVLAWSPGSPSSGTTVTFTGAATDNDGTVVEATLCFGDGSPCRTIVEPRTPMELALACALGDGWTERWLHKYTRTGSFTARLTVTTRGCSGLPDETASTSAQISVR